MNIHSNASIQKKLFKSIKSITCLAKEKKLFINIPDSFLQKGLKLFKWKELKIIFLLINYNTVKFLYISIK